MSTRDGTSRLGSVMRIVASMDDCAAPPWEELIGVGPAGSGGTAVCEALSGKRILVTGAGGSIGSALAAAAWASRPAGLVLLDTSENGLYQVDRSLHEAGSHEHVSVLGSVCDAEALEELLERHRPQIIFHAAALKHVPLMERNPFAAIENNALGTYTLARAAAAHGVEHLVLASTDKAVDPVSIMGASKRIAELVLLALGSASTRMSAVRLCNVMGSQGSVLPLFLEQIAAGGPLTVTDRGACRYFITVERAVESLVEALTSHLHSQPDARILVGEPGSAVRILDLAEHLIRAHASSATIEFTGLRPGDKLSERVLSSRERLATEGHIGGSGLRAIESPSASRDAVQAALQELQEAVRARDLGRLLRGVLAVVPEYRPSEVIDATLGVAVAEYASSEMASVMQA